MTPGQPRLRMTGIEKSFGSTRALRGVDLDVYEGEVVALVGENGAGKSTLMKVLSGAHSPDAGRIEFEGAAYRPRSPHDARVQGVAMIYQELALAPHLTAAENILLGRDRRRFGVLKRREERAVARSALERVGRPDISLDLPVRSLNPAERQSVEIARAVAAEARVLVMDEPTSSLTSVEIDRLFEAIRDLRKRGASIVYISHFLEEAAEIADRVVVLRDGETVGGGLAAELGIGDIVRLMVGREIEELFPKAARSAGEVLLEVRDLHGVRLPKGVSIDLRRGEVLGIAGLVGAGRTEFLRALFGLDPIRLGSVKLAGLLRRTGGTGIGWRDGVGMVSEDRKGEGLAAGLSIAENLTLTRLRPFTTRGFLSPWKRDAAGAEWAERLGIVCGRVSDPVSSLSGGNQQKTAFARLLHHDADLFLLDEPTRGVDVASKAKIYSLIGEAAASGRAVLMVSSYLPELFGICDRIAVMRRGLLSEARDVSNWTEEEVLQYAAAAA